MRFGEMKWLHFGRFQFFLSREHWGLENLLIDVMGFELIPKEIIVIKNTLYANALA